MVYLRWEMRVLISSSSYLVCFEISDKAEKIMFSATSCYTKSNIQYSIKNISFYFNPIYKNLLIYSTAKS